MTLVGFPPLTDAALMRLGDLNPGWSFERDDEGAIEVTPTSWKSGGASAEALGQLRAFAHGAARGRAFDSSTGYSMSTKAVRSPDASWVRQERLDAAQMSHSDGFFPGAPDVAIEIASPTDRWSRITRKIDMYIREGSVYAVALDLRAGLIYEQGHPPAGLTLDFDAIREAGS